MPPDTCHPAAPHKKLRVPNWYASSLMTDRALDAILRRVKVDYQHDIPYLAGYSLDNSTVYIDRHLPRFFEYKGRKIEVARYLIMHEEVEKTLIDQLDLHYLHAHQIATRAEQAAIRADKISWRAYDRFMQKYVKRIGDERLSKVPKDLDYKPYRDEHDEDLIARMQKTEPKEQRKKHVLLTKTKTKVAVKSKAKPKAKTKAKPKAKAKAKLKNKSKAKS